jgi:mannan endo-1,4-beta-mannosidase
MRRLIFGALCALLGSSLLLAHSFKPVNKNTSKEARELLEYLYSLSGEKILSGHHNYIHELTRYTGEVKKLTGKYPAIWGGDFSAGWRRKSNFRDDLIKQAIEQHEKGVIVTLMWHCKRPVDTVHKPNWETVRGEMTSEQWDEFLTPGTHLNGLWLEQIDEVANYLKILEDKNIPVLWRPYHEMNGVWFWWCNKPGEKGFQRLWKSMYDRFVHHHKLNNLIWVWNANAPRDTPGDEAYAYEPFYPGNEYVDVLAADVYHNDYRQSHHDQLMDLGKGKLIALGEVGQVPTPGILEQQPYWTWFMCWANWIEKKNDPEDFKKLYNDPRVLTFEEIQD